MTNFLFSSVVLLVLADGIILLISPTTHAVLMNGWNAFLGMPPGLRVDAYRGARWRINGAVVVALCGYILLKSWHIA